MDGIYKDQDGNLVYLEFKTAPDDDEVHESMVPALP